MPQLLEATAALVGSESENGTSTRREGNKATLQLHDFHSQCVHVVTNERHAATLQLFHNAGIHLHA